MARPWNYPLSTDHGGEYFRPVRSPPNKNSADTFQRSQRDICARRDAPFVPFDRWPIRSSPVIRLRSFDLTWIYAIAIEASSSTWHRASSSLHLRRFLRSFQVHRQPMPVIVPRRLMNRRCVSSVCISRYTLGDQIRVADFAISFPFFFVCNAYIYGYSIPFFFFFFNRNVFQYRFLEI